MHLDHKIPWATAASHYDFKRRNRSFVPHRTDLFCRNLSTTKPDTERFINAFITTLKEFSNTERQKYEGPSASSDDAEPLISDEIRLYGEANYGLQPYQSNSVTHNPICEDYQRIQYWRSRVRRREPYTSGYITPLYYCTSDGDLADAVKMLIVTASSSSQHTKDLKPLSAERQAMKALVKLSQDPDIPIRALNGLSWGHSFGVDHVLDGTLQIYMTVNIFDALRNSTSKYKSMSPPMSILELQSLRSFLHWSLSDYDYPAQNIPHIFYWKKWHVSSDWAYYTSLHAREGMDVNVLEHPLKNRDGSRTKIIDPMPFYDSDETAQAREEMKEYMKLCFSILYHYDVLCRMWYGDEATDQRWRDEIKMVLGRWMYQEKNSY